MGVIVCRQDDAIELHAGLLRHDHAVRFESFLLLASPGSLTSEECLSELKNHPLPDKIGWFAELSVQATKRPLQPHRRDIALLIDEIDTSRLN